MNKETKKLLPCPFCGESLRAASEASAGGAVIIQHPSNACFLRYTAFGEHSRTFKEWNTRAPTPQPDPQFSNYQTDGGI